MTPKQLIPFFAGALAIMMVLQFMRSKPARDHHWLELEEKINRVDIHEATNGQILSVKPGGYITNENDLDNYCLIFGREDEWWMDIAAIDHNRSNGNPTNWLITIGDLATNLQAVLMSSNGNVWRITFQPQ